MLLRRLLPALLLVGACAPPPATAPAPARDALTRALDSIFADSAFARARWGVHVRSLRSGRDLYRLDASKLFVPASNQKLVTGAVALEALGPDYRFATAVDAVGPVSGGVLRGDVVIRGGGDPAISAAFGGAKPIFRAWADSLRAHGVTRITGALVGDDDALDDLPLGAGWAWDDVDAPYSAEVGALELNEGYVAVRVRPGARPGDAARVELDPPTGFVPVDNRVTTVAGETRIDAARAPGGSGILLTGTIAADTPRVETGVAIRDNTRFFLRVLAETLRESGIQVEGREVDADSLPTGPPAGVRLFAHRSPPLSEVMPAFLKPSQNQIGELLLKTLGRELRGEGSARAGIAVLDSVTRAWGLPAGGLRSADGSGLSRYDLVAPEFLVALLEHMDRGPNGALFRESLPAAGRDGTLASRMSGTPLAGNVHAKTGTLSGVRSLSGYLTTAAGEPVVFSILANSHTRAAREVDRVAEAALLRVYQGR